MFVELIDVDPSTVEDPVAFRPWIPGVDLGPRLHESISKCSISAFSNKCPRGCSIRSSFPFGGEGRFCEYILAS